PPADAAKVAAAPAPGKVAVQGRVLDPNGKPVAGAKLYLPAIPKPDGRTPLLDADAFLMATTGPDGSFRFETEPTPPAMSHLRTLTAVADGFAADWSEPLKPGPDGELVLRLVRDDVPIRGRVVDLEGRPVAGATVKVVSLETTPPEALSAVWRAWRSDSYQALHLATKKHHVPRAAKLPGTLQTDADGRFELRGVGRGRMVVLQITADTIEHRTVRAVAQPGFDPKVA